MPIEYGVYTGGGEAIRRGLGGIGDVLTRVGMMQYGMAQDAQERAERMAEHEYRRRMDEQRLEMDRKREERLAQKDRSAALIDSLRTLQGAETPGEARAVVSTLRTVVPGYMPGMEGTPDFTIQPPDLPGIDSRVALTAPGAPAAPDFSPLDRPGQEVIAGLESIPSEPLYEWRGVKLPFEELLENQRQYMDASRMAPAQGGTGGGSDLRPTSTDIKNVLDPLVKERDPVVGDEVLTIPPSDYARLYAGAREQEVPLSALADSVEAIRARSAPDTASFGLAEEEGDSGPGPFSRVLGGIARDYATVGREVGRRVGDLFDGGDKPERRLGGPAATDEVAGESLLPPPTVDDEMFIEAQTLARRALENGFTEEEVVQVLVEDLGFDEGVARALVEKGG